jgi:hypothetical protein
MILFLPDREHFPFRCFHPSLRKRTMPSELIWKSNDVVFFINSWLPKFPVEWDRTHKLLVYNPWNKCRPWCILLATTMFVIYPLSVGYTLLRYYYFPTPEITMIHVIVLACILQMVILVIGVAVNIMPKVENLVPLANEINRYMDTLKTGKSQT